MNENNNPGAAFNGDPEAKKMNSVSDIRCVESFVAQSKLQSPNL